MRIGVTGWPAAMSALRHRPATAARANAGGGVRGGCVPLAGQALDRPYISGSLNRLSCTGPLKGKGASDPEVGIRDYSSH
ncbi:hypothetical protein P7K49_023414 [Saguinus oedipus]|uniref:Uncharacterized protein n=1 Tax=Saguinus oedipus TaxID=9490 RepID=A0ABQ9ULN8_SAGOE|nr:hypothetical protein P7K49_023414 [Saguinus oedipus]